MSCALLLRQYPIYLSRHAEPRPGIILLRSVHTVPYRHVESFITFDPFSGIEIVNLQQMSGAVETVGILNVCSMRKLHCSLSTSRIMDITIGVLLRLPKYCFHPLCVLRSSVDESAQRRQVLIRRHSQRQVTRGMTRKISELEMRLGDSELAHDLVMASESQFAAKGGKGEHLNF